MKQNPFKTIRLYIGLTQKDLGKVLDLTAQTVGNYELGLISNPPTSILEGYIHNFSPVARGEKWESIRMTPSGLEDAYDEWIYRQRLIAARVFSGPNSSMEFVPTKGTHPFIAWRERAVGSRYNFCRLLCVPVATLTKYETCGGPIRPWLRDVLVTAGYGPEDLIVLDQTILKWEKSRDRRTY